MTDSLNPSSRLRADNEGVEKYPDCWADCGEGFYCCDGGWDTEENRARIFDPHNPSSRLRAGERP